jgi:hypothetical protein
VKETILFLIAFVRVCLAVWYGEMLERSGPSGERRSGIIIYKAMKKLAPKLKTFTACHPNIWGTMEAGIKNLEAQRIIHDCRQRVLELRNA